MLCLKVIRDTKIRSLHIDMKFVEIQSKNFINIVESKFSIEFHNYLIKLIENNLCNSWNSDGPQRTEWDFFCTQNSNKCIEFRQWLFAQLTNSLPIERLSGIPPEEYNFFLKKIQLTKCWGVVYNKGQWATEHNHMPFTHSFVYYLRTPENSSPIVMENNTFFVKENDCIFFPSHINHSVPPNQCDGRYVIAGNFNWVS